MIAFFTTKLKANGNNVDTDIASSTLLEVVTSSILNYQKWLHARCCSILDQYMFLLEAGINQRLI